MTCVLQTFTPEGQAQAQAHRPLQTILADEHIDPHVFSFAKL